jgi:hypothetical protein
MKTDIAGSTSEASEYCSWYLGYATSAVAVDIDLHSYFARIAYSGPNESTLPVLCDVHACHLAQIAFEGLDRPPSTLSFSPAFC